MRFISPPSATRARLRRGVVVGTTLALGAGLATVVSTQAHAATGCAVAYTTNEWPGGFTANVAVTNLGDAVESWTLEWDFADGQTVQQGWNGVFSQSGSHVTVTNAAYNGGIATNGTVIPGFNGSWTSANSAPSSFTLNGVTCTGSASTTSPTATSTATGSPSSSATSAPTATASSSSSSSSSSGVPSDAVWSGTGAWDSWTSDDGYTIINDVWGSGAGAQTIWARSGTNWGVISSQPSTSGVKSYPHNAKTIDQSLSSLTTLKSSFDVTVPSTGSYATAYDIWANDYAYEIMIWMNQNGEVGPIASSYDSNGAVPDEANLTVGGHTWNVYSGSNGSNTVYSFVRTSNTNSGTVDVLAVLDWLTTNGWWSGVSIVDVQFGFELTSTADNAEFVCDTCTIDYS